MSATASRMSRQERFHEEYRQGGDPAQAAMRAGYSPAHAARVAARLLAQGPEAQALPAPRPSLGIVVDRDTVLAGLLQEATDRGKGATQACRLKAWELIAKMCGLFEARTEDDASVHFDIHLGASAEDQSDAQA